MEILQDYSYLAFIILAVTSVICSLTMIFNPNLVRAGFALIGSFAAIAGIYFTLAANFVAVSQVLIYAVGIVLVIVFAVMLCSLKENAENPGDIEQSSSEVRIREVLALLASGSLCYVLFSIINNQDWSIIAHATGADVHKSIVSQISDQYTAQIGNLMLSKYVLAFELISVLLLAVLIGVIILSKRNTDERFVKKEEKKAAPAPAAW